MVSGGLRFGADFEEDTHSGKATCKITCLCRFLNTTPASLRCWLRNLPSSKEGLPPGLGRSALAGPLLHELHLRLLSLPVEVRPRQDQSPWPHTALSGTETGALPPSIRDS